VNERSWFVTINGWRNYTIQAPTIFDAVGQAGDQWRAAYAEGEDRGTIESVQARAASVDNEQDEPAVIERSPDPHWFL
jgi:hypothetical protein